MPLKREVQFIVRFNEGEAAELRQRAEAADETVSRYVRRRALEDPEQVVELRAQIDRLTERLAKYADMAEQYDNLAALLADPRWLPSTRQNG